MATVVKKLLSGSTNGRAIKVAATADPGTTIHTAVAGITSWDEIWLYAYCSNATGAQLVIEWGSNLSPDNVWNTTLPVPNNGLVLVCPGLVLNNGDVVKAWATTANVVTLTGFINNIT